MINQMGLFSSPGQNTAEALPLAAKANSSQSRDPIVVDNIWGVKRARRESEDEI